MNTNWPYIQEHIEEFPEYKSAIFEQGFLVTNTACEFGEEYPYFSNWREEPLCESAHLYLHVNQKAYVLNKDGIAYFIIGHAYDPFGYEKDENKLLEKLADICGGDFKSGIAYINDWTGLFVLGIIRGNEFTLCSDYESYRAAYYGKVEDRWYIASHEELVALREELTRDEYVTKLEGYRWYHLYGEGLPGDISHYHELKKFMGNTYIDYADGEFSITRFFPEHEIKMAETEEEYTAVVKNIADIMKATLELTAEKWGKPAISATGGRDSKGTIAASCHIKNSFLYYSYNSQLAEKVDCDAAKKICDTIGVAHATHDIPLEKEVYPEYDLSKAILCVNSNRLYFNHNDIMKHIYFRRNQLFDIEVKSWTSEIGRAYYYARYGVKRMQKKCSGRRLNAMNNIYLLNPDLMYWADGVYEDYIRRTNMRDGLFNYDWTDMAKSELRHSRWGADVISCEHMFGNDVTIPYNNRHLSDLMLSVPLEKRIASQTHKDFTALLSPEIAELNLNVQNYNHDTKRMWMDKIYYFITSIRPF